MVLGTVRIERFPEFSVFGRIAENDLGVVMQGFQRIIIAIIISLAVRDGNTKRLAGLHLPGKDRQILFRPDPGMFTNEFQRPIPEHRPRQKPGFQKDLKPVADPDDGTSLIGVLDHSFHDRRKTSNGSRSKIVPIAETARDD
jgi:hypothetical protein